MRGRKWVFLAPCSNPVAQKYFKDTILDGVRFGDIEIYLKEDDKIVLQDMDKLRIWGNIPGKRKGWEEMELGDIVLFYQRGKFIHKGKVYHKIDNEELAKKLWPDYEEGKPWRYMYFLQDIQKVDVPLSLIIKYLGYKIGYVLRGFQSLNPKAMDAITKEYGSVEGFVRAHAIAPIYTETDKLCLSLLKIVKAEELLDKHVNAETIRKWTEALKGFSARKRGENYDEWISKYDFAALAEIYNFITGMEEIFENEFDLSDIETVSGLSPSESSVLCGFRALQRKYLPIGQVNMNPHKYNVLKVQLLETEPTGFWIFVVTDHREARLTAAEIFDTRMGDRFWGLGERTPNRKKLRKGDKVVFSYGSKSFLGTAVLASDSYELSDDEREAFGHENSFFEAKYGVRLTNIDKWDAQKPASSFVPNLSFIKRKEIPHVYFQGGVRSISKEDFELVTGRIRKLALIGATGTSYIERLREFISSHEACWSGWTFRIPRVQCEILNKQLSTDGKFSVYLHNIKSRGGSGKLEWVGLVDNYVTSHEAIDTPEPQLTREGEIEWYRKPEVTPAKTWLRFTKICDLEPFIDLSLTKDYFKGSPIYSGSLQNRFAPIVDLYPIPVPPKVTLSEIDRRIIAHLVTGRNIIFYGPPGTGKTRKAVQIAKRFCGNNFSFETANAEWTAYDVVGGPTFSGKTALKIKPGFLTLAAKKCSESLKNTGLPYWLIIDEINRANLDLAFGKVFSLLDVEYREQTIFDDSELVGMENSDEYRDSRIPQDFRVFATMNTYDTALLFSLGYAFRRRFAFIEVASPFLEKIEDKYEPDEEEWKKLELSSKDQIDVIMNEIEDWIRGGTFLHLSETLKESLQLSKDLDLDKTLRMINEDIKNGKFDPFNPYMLACKLSEEITQQGIIEAGYAQPVDVVKYTLTYAALFSESDERVTMVKALDEAVKAYLIPHVEYYLPRARRKMTIGEKEEEEEAINKLKDFEGLIERLGLTRSQKKIQEIVSRLKMGETRIF